MSGGTARPLRVLFLVCVTLSTLTSATLHHLLSIGDPFRQNDRLARSWEKCSQKT